MTVALVANIARPISSALSTAFNSDNVGLLAGYGILGVSNPDAVIEALFASGEQGAWYDPSDLSTMFQDSAGTTPVTAAGQPVGKILDKSGNGNHATELTGVTLKKNNGSYFLELLSGSSFFTPEITIPRDFFYAAGVSFMQLITEYQGIFNVRRTGGSGPSDDIQGDYSAKNKHFIDRTVNQAYPSLLYSTKATGRPYFGQRYVTFGNHDYASTFKIGDFFAGSTNEAGTLTKKNFVPGAGKIKVMSGYNNSACDEGHLYGFIFVCAPKTDLEISDTVTYLTGKSSLVPAPYFMPRSRAPYTAMDTSTNYDAFGFGMQADDGTRLYFARSSPDLHVLDKGVVVQGTYSGGWSRTTVVNTAYDDRNASGGKTPTGALCLFYARQNYTTGVWVDMQVIRSTDHGATWSSAVSLSLNGTTEFSPYGPLVSLPSGKLMQTMYGWAGSTNKLWVTFSSDDGANWGNEVDIYSGTGFSPNEASACFISGATDGSSKIIVISRNETGALRQYTSGDGGQSWVDGGALVFSAGSGKDVSPWLYKDGENIYLAYADRTVGNFKGTYGNAESVYSNKASWHEPEVVRDHISPVTINWGYPSFYRDSEGEVIFQYYDSAEGGGSPYIPNIYSSYP